MQKKIEQAFIEFQNGKRPEGYKPPRHWYVLDTNGVAYPAKAIYALAINERPGNFNTRDARMALTELEYSVINTTLIDNTNDFDEKVIKSLKDSKEKREERLKSAECTPQTKYVLAKQYIRNPDVVASVLERAGKRCENCNSVAPFNRKSDNTPYLEVHHKKQLAKGGEDSVQNAIALCPNCHRKMHFG